MHGCETADSSTALPTTTISGTSASDPSIVQTAHVSSSAPSNAPTLAPDSLQKPGFAAYMYKQRLRVFRKGSRDLKEFLVSGEPAKSVTRIGAGPGGVSIRAVDAETIGIYLAVR